jgi:hypothetical protein
VSLRAQEENSDDQENGEKHLYEQALRNGSAATKAGTCGQRSGEECAGNTRRGDAADNLDDNEESATQGRDSLDEDKSECDLLSITVRSFKDLKISSSWRDFCLDESLQFNRAIKTYRWIK